MVLLPSVGQQDKEFFFGSFLEVGHRGYDGVEIETRIYVMVAACRKQRLYDAHVLSRLMVATEEIVLASERDGTDLVLGKIVIEQKPSVVEHAHHRLPPRVGICDRFAGERTLAVADPFGLKPFPHFLHNWSGLFLPFSLAGIEVHSGLVAFMLDVVEFPYLAEEP